MGNNSIPLQQSVWVTRWVLRLGLRAGGRLDETRKPTVREKQQGLRVRPSSGGGLGARCWAGRSELPRAGGSVGKPGAEHSWRTVGWWLASPPAPRPRVEGSTHRQIPLALFNVPWKMGPILSEGALPALVDPQDSPQLLSDPHREDWPWDTGARYPGRSLPSSPCPSS